MSTTSTTSTSTTISKPIKKAVQVGIDYKNIPDIQLRGCINDITDTNKILITNYGYDPKYVLILTDDSKYKPTAENIRRSWRWLNSGATAADFMADEKTWPVLPGGSTLFWQYSGHGSYVRDLSGDEADGYDETIVPIDFQDKKVGMITDDELRVGLVSRVPSSCTLTALIDSCHSGTIFDLPWQLTSKPGGGYTTINDKKYADTAAPTIVFTAALDGELASDVYYAYQYSGALTVAFLNTLKANAYKPISCGTLLTGTQNFIKTNRLSNQTPSMSFGKFATYSTIFVL